MGVGDHSPYVITALIEEEGQQQQQQQQTSTRLAVTTACSRRTWNDTSLTRFSPLSHVYASPSRVHRPASLPRRWDWIPPGTTTYDVDDDDIVDFTPHRLPHEERFEGVAKLVVTCSDCDEEAEISRVLSHEGWYSCIGPVLSYRSTVWQS